MSAISAVFRCRGSQILAPELAALAGAGSLAGQGPAAIELRGEIGLALREPAGVAPAVAQRGGRLLAADARIDNRRELVAALGDAPGTSASDAELLLTAYERWGIDCLPRLSGDFAFILWDAPGRRLLAARDALGICPLHWVRVGDTLLLATEACQLSAHPEVGRRPDLTALADYLLARPSEPWRSFWEGIRVLPPGNFLIADDGGERLRRYWSPAEIAAEPEMSEQEADERFLALLRRAVSDRLRGCDQACGVMVSGGLDSSAVAVVASEQLRQRSDGARLAPYAYHFEELASCDESAYRDALARRLGEPIEPLAGEEYWLLRESEDFQPAADSPFVGFQSLAREALRRLQLRRGGVLLTGHGGDAVVSGSACVYADELRRGRLGVLREIGEHARERDINPLSLAWHWGLRPLLPARLQEVASGDRQRELPDWIEPAFGRSIGLEDRLRRREEVCAEGSAARRAIVGLLSGLQADRSIAHWYRRLGARYGVDVRYPFLDRRLVEQVLVTPTRFLFRAGRYKMLLRRALHGLLPEEIRGRLDKTRFGEFHDYSWRRLGADRIRQLLGRSVLVDAGILRRDRLDSSVEAYLRGESDDLRAHLWFVITAEVWLSRQAGYNDGPGASFES